MIDNSQVTEDNTYRIHEQHNVNVIRKRFLQLNSARLARMRESLANRHGMVLDILPLLFHTNHPMMPGFVKSTAPSKIVHYHPSKDELLAGKRVARSFTYRPQVNKKSDITGLYIMGSVGTIAQSEGSDLDIWVCHNPSLCEHELNQLQTKCDRIRAWAEQQKLEIHFFLMNPEAFKRGELSALDGESSGTAQRLLLLDEFYRTAIYMAGAIPAWWFVPASSEINYQHYLTQLVHYRFINHQDIIDFGDTSHIPSSEFIGAGIWQLYKAIASPYKSVLKVLLLEAYVSQYPNIEPLSYTFKQRVFNGETDINQLDSYVLTYQKIENYLLTHNQPRRLELARRCFYLKINKPLSKPINGQKKSWQRCQIEDMVNAWGWTREQLQHIDNHYDWKTSQVYSERNMLVAELNHSYRVLLKFANTINSVGGHAISAEELTVLGRQLNAAFERRPGKIEWINPSISNDLSEQTISLVKSQTQEQTELWNCFTPQNDTRINLNSTKQSYTLTNKILVSDTLESDYEHHVLKKHANPYKPVALRAAASLLEILLWLQINNISSEYTNFDLSLAPDLHVSKLRKIIYTLHTWEPLNLPNPNHEIFKRSAQPTHVLLLLNIDESLKSGTHAQVINHNFLSNNSANDYQVFSADIAVRNSWNEITTEHFAGEKSLLNMLIEFLHLCLPGTYNSPPKLHIASFGNNYTANIAKKVNEWLLEIVNCYYRDHPASTRFIYEQAKKIYCLQFHGMKPRVTTLNSIDQLIEHLGHEQAKYSAIVFESQSLVNHPLKIMAKTIKPGGIYVFYRLVDMGIEIYVADERGSMTHSTYRGRKDHNPLKPLHRFMRSVIQRQLLANNELVADFGIFPIHFFQLIASHNKNFSVIRKQVSPESIQEYNLDICATAYTQNVTDEHGNTRKHLTYDIHCGDQIFLYQEHGKQLFAIVAEFVVSYRKNNDTYPIYLSDLNLHLWKDNETDIVDLQISHYLRIKNALEFQLNKAIRNIQLD